MRLLNNKHEFGANLLLEVVVMRGDQILEKRNPKRRRGGEVVKGSTNLEPTQSEMEAVEATTVMGKSQEEVEKEGGGVEAENGREKEERRTDEREDIEEEVEGETSPPPQSQPKKKTRTSYECWTEEELGEELVKRRFKVRRRKKEDMIVLLEEEDKKQGKIVWGRKHVEGKKTTNYDFRGEIRGGEEEKEGEEAKPNTSEEEEADWVDILPEDQEADGREAMGRPAKKPKQGRQSPVKVAGRLQGGLGKRGFWVKR